jgi:ribonuclease P protein component
LHGDATFPSREHLRRGADFRRAYDTGRRGAGRLLVVYAVPATTGVRQVGFVTSRRVGNAVVRNRVRRLMREAYRLNKMKFSDHLQLVVIARPAARGAAFVAVQSELLELCRQLAIVKPS